MTKGVVAILLLGGCAPLADILPGGKDVTEFSVVDLDGDAQVTSKELGAWGREQGVYESLGGEATEIDPLDLASGLYGLWNQEGSGLTEAEWIQGMNRWLPDAKAGEYQEWDFDGDGTLDEDELRAGFAHTGVANVLDTDGDGVITENETYAAIFRVFDFDGDEIVTQQEWRSGIDGWGWNL